MLPAIGGRNELLLKAVKALMQEVEGVLSPAGYPLTGEIGWMTLTFSYSSDFQFYNSFAKTHVNLDMCFPSIGPQFPHL